MTARPRWREYHATWKANHAGLEWYDQIKLAEWGVIEKHGNRYRLPADTKAGIWRHYVDPGPDLPDEAAFKRYCSIRRRLDAGDEEHTNAVVSSFIAFLGDEPVSVRRIRSLLGNFPCPSGEYARIRAMMGTGDKVEARRVPGTFDELLAELPVETRGRFAARLQVARIPPIIPPRPLHIGRVLRLRGEPMRLLGVARLLGDSAARSSVSTVAVHVSELERYDAILDAASQRDGEHVADQMKRYLDGELLPTDTSKCRLRTLSSYPEAFNTTIPFVQEVLGEDAERLLESFPARHPDEKSLIKTVWELRSANAAVTAQTRADKVIPVVERLAELMAAVENRLHPLEGLLGACMEQLPNAVASLDAGLTAGFTWTGQVVRSDGSLGAGEQIVSFRFERESTLLVRAHAREPGNSALRSHLPPREGIALRVQGSRHRPEHWDRIHLVYEGTRPVVAGDEVVEPFFVDIFRWGLLEPDGRLPDTIKVERRRVLAKLGLANYRAPVEGLLTNAKSRRVIARLARGADPETGDVVVGLVEFYHAMAYARIVVRYGIRWGARLGEILQIRLGSDCFRKHRVDGKWSPYLSMRPKGWKKDGKFGLDPGTAKAMRSVKELTNYRWHRGLRNEKGEPTLLVVPSGDTQRTDLKPARYLFQCGGRALRAQEVTSFVTVLLMGLLDMRSHDGRYVFSTVLGLNGVAYKKLGVLLHHSPASPMPAKYDLSMLIMPEDAAEAYNLRLEAGLAGSILGG